MKISELKKEDRNSLKMTYTKLYSLKFPWADDDFLKDLVSHSCKKVIEQMDLEEYLKDLKKREDEIDYF